MFGHALGALLRSLATLPYPSPAMSVIKYLVAHIVMFSKVLHTSISYITHIMHITVQYTCCYESLSVYLCMLQSHV